MCETNKANAPLKTTVVFDVMDKVLVKLILVASSLTGHFCTETSLIGSDRE